MKITVLLENTAAQENILSEHGLSLYIQTDDHNILFDMGQTDAFARNAEALGIDLRDVDIAFLSHGHYDHGGGLTRFLEINDHAPVYLNRRAFGEYYHSPEKYIGLAKALKQSARLRYADENLVIDPTLSLHAQNTAPLARPIRPFGLSELQNGIHIPDTFAHEQYLLIREGEKTVLVSGCAHKGVVNISRWFDPDVLIGGFHLTKLNPDNSADRDELESIAHELLSARATYYTGHCTGDHVYAFLKERMGERLHSLSAGLTFEI